VWWSWRSKKCADERKKKSKSWWNGEEGSKWELERVYEGAERPVGNGMACGKCKTIKETYSVALLLSGVVGVVSWEGGKREWPDLTI
jgi:hypothetical protein